MAFFNNQVVFIRHGQTEWNLVKKTQGHLNSPLTEKGLFQAKEVADKLKNYDFDLIVSSPLGRALETAKILSAELKIEKLITNVNLSERHLGVLQGKTKEESLVSFPQFFNENQRFIHESEIPDGETLSQFLSRIKIGMEELKELSITNKMLVVTHDGVLHAIMAFKNNIEFKEVQNHYRFENCEPVFLS